jgi:hypothetical protein
MRFTLGGVRRAAAILTASLAVPAILAGSAAAQAVGIPDLSAHVDGNTGPAAAVLQNEYTVTSPGYINELGASYSCTDGCGDIRLVVLRETSTPGDWEVVKRSEAITPSHTETWWRWPIAKIKVKAGDKIGLDLTPGVSLNYTLAPEGSLLLSSTDLAQPTKVFETTQLARQGIYFALMESLPSVKTKFADTAPETILAGTTATYDVELSSPDAESPAPPITGTVSFSVEGTPLAGCQDVPVVDAKASCQDVAPAQQTYREITATYSGDENYVASKAAKLYQFVFEPASVQALVSPNPVERSANIGYGAEIANVQLESVGTAETDNYGTAAFFVDGQPVAGCATQPVNRDGLAKCLATAPDVVGPHTLKVVYSGDDLRGANSGQTTFDVIGAAAQVTDAVAFGSVGLGTTTPRTVTVTSTGKLALKPVAAALTGDGAFSLVTDGCAGTKLAHGATCDVVVAYSPTAAGTHTATLALGEGIGTVALAGTAVAPAPPVAPTPTATPTPPPVPKAATIDPAKKPTFTVSVPAGSNAGAASVPTLKLPLACPANTECQLDGKLTIEESALAGRKVRASAAATKTVAKFSRVQVEAGGLKTVKLKLSKAFVKSAQQRGIRRIRATLTINTVLGTGEKLTTAQRITIVLPKAVKQQAAKPKVAPRFTG